MEHLGTSDSVEAYWNAALPHIQAHYCHSTLGTKIKIETIGFKHYEGKRLTATRPNVRDMYGPTAEDIGSADLMVYMCHDSSGNDFTVGLAPTGSICGNRDEYKLSINEWESTASGFAFVILLWSFF